MTALVLSDADVAVAFKLPERLDRASNNHFDFALK
jgi:hypothetical protein